MPNVNLPCPFTNSQLLCQLFCYHWCTCYTIHNCFKLVHSELNSNPQQEGVARSTSNGGRRTAYSFPESSSDPNSVIRRCPLSVQAFLLIGYWLRLLVYFRGGIWDTQLSSQSEPCWSFLLHLKQRLSLFSDLSDPVIQSLSRYHWISISALILLRAVSYLRRYAACFGLCCRPEGGACLCIRTLW